MPYHSQAGILFYSKFPSIGFCVIDFSGMRFQINAYLQNDRSPCERIFLNEI